MMRGKRTLYEEKVTQPKHERILGRSKKLIDERNIAICNRYYFYYAFFQLKYETIIKLISDDFYLAEYTITEILTQKVSKQVQEIKKAKPQLKDLCKMYLHLNWDIEDMKKKAALLTDNKAA